MESLHVDLLVIGFGKGGKTLAARMGAAGRRVALVEQSAQMYGGTCINIGCVPTKALIHHAQSRRPGEPAQDSLLAAVSATTTLTDALRDRNFAMLDDIDSVTVLTGRARFLDEKSVEVSAGSDRLVVTAPVIVVNTGAEPVLPDIPGLRSSAHLRTSTDLIRAEGLPERLVVVGGGYLGLEFAGMYARFGSRVTVLEAGPRLLPREDADVAEATVGTLRDEGVTFVTDAEVVEVTDEDGHASVRYRAAGEEHVLDTEAVLVATGRRPATAGLDLEVAGVRTTERGAIEVDEHLRSSRPHIFAVGDVNGGPQFTYISLDDSRIVADQLLGSGARTTADREAVPYTLFTTPPLSRVGLTEREARERGHDVRVAAKPVAQIAAMPRAKIVGETRGLMKFVIDAATDRILGAALLSVDSQELVNTVALAMRHGVTASELRDTIYTHPSSTEAFNEVLGAVRR
ncbi:FAD-dependent oxidoreductase [Streptomyces sp. NRRL S-31]|uniref:FAD-dependent oxidoreductase n=1 Tax=Streptomyces sp. NRRL S-31 TaxID=1463898 RepID=UPI0004CB9115|nr:FAD-dependent oxidoreductase [Streptomyces sp. NRRL S-31]